MRKIFLVSMLLVISCYRKPYDPIALAQKDDLNPNVIRVFENEMNSFYKIDTTLKNDLYVLMLRSELMNNFPSTPPTMAILSLGSIRDRPNCEYLKEKVSKEKMQEAKQHLGDRFFCFDSTYTDDQVISKNAWLTSDSLNSPWNIDAHMGWFSATGARRPVEKLISNWANNQKACSCIFWAVTSVGSQDSLFKKFALDEIAKYESSPKIDSLKARLTLDIQKVGAPR